MPQEIGLAADASGLMRLRSGRDLAVLPMTADRAAATSTAGSEKVAPLVDPAQGKRQPSRRGIHVLLLIGCSGLLFAEVSPWGAGEVSLISLCVLLVCLLGWVSAARGYRRSRSTAAVAGRARWFLVAPAVLMLMAGLDWIDAPSRTKWAMSPSAFDQLAAEAKPGLDRSEKRAIKIDGRVGLYWSESVYQRGEAVVVVEDYGAIDRVGFAYLPKGRFADLDRDFEFDSLDHVGGDWYRWRDSF